MKIARLIISGLIVASAGASAVAGPAVGDWQTFKFDWDGEAYGNTAHITALIELDLNQFPIVATDHNGYLSLSSSAIGDFSLTVSGATAAGNYTKADFLNLYFISPGPLDQTKNFVGQPLPNNTLFGSGARESGNAGIVGADGVAVGYAGDVTMMLAPTGQTIQYLALQSIYNVSALAAVPEPETYAMLLAGMGLMAGMVRRKQKVLAAR
ncbi:PEP-CTERM sorting domain-containing protein [Xylophilus sp. GOD-11R]|uniref:PEP-CTERM sorting domain-containing protein n=1 Tax=Xylophilus sp. GOD-11R TaxID=3089814 RepID=UPI00298CE3CA|nr:PEP-CTERM sorting domain-containing protein [Xylophilus sp. GOD-11R]WPB57747.1 PEP-CTERM sorting domain-containing protein [Xylophilus sp. GOD-11R]